MTVISSQDLHSAWKTLLGYSDDPKTVTGIVPDIVKKCAADIAYEMVCCAESRQSVLPELFALFNTPGLGTEQLKDMVHAVFSVNEPLTPPIIQNLADSVAQAGRYGFSFPQWRYLAQAFDGVSLLEHFGMKKLKRETDLRDPSLPDPDRDLFGTGYIALNGTTLFEYRRAYIACIDLSEENRAVVVIRNNSYFFGRDRLHAPVLVSYQPVSIADMVAMTENDFADAKLFSPLQKIEKSSPEIPLIEKVSRVRRLMNSLDAFDQKLSLWLRNGNGLQHLCNFLQSKLDANKPSGLPVIGVIDADMPPWFPKATIEMTSDLLSQLREYPESGFLPSDVERVFYLDPKEKMILLTGKNGDLPLKPKTASTASAPASHFAK